LIRKKSNPGNDEISNLKLQKGICTAILYICLSIAYIHVPWYKVSNNKIDFLHQHSTARNPADKSHFTTNTVPGYVYHTCPLFKTIACLYQENGDHYM
jgi:hypothetical protein